MFHLPPSFIDQVLVPATGVRHIRLAHGHLLACRPPPIEVVGDRATAGLWHQRLEPNDLVPDPGRFRLVTSYATVTSSWLLWLLMRHGWPC